MRGAAGTGGGGQALQVRWMGGEAVASRACPVRTGRRDAQRGRACRSGSLGGGCGRRVRAAGAGRHAPPLASARGPLASRGATSATAPRAVAVGRQPSTGRIERQARWARLRRHFGATTAKVPGLDPLPPSRALPPCSAGWLVTGRLTAKRLLASRARAGGRGPLARAVSWPCCRPGEYPGRGKTGRRPPPPPGAVCPKTSQSFPSCPAPA